MSEPRIARVIPDLADTGALLNMLSETLTVARGAELGLRDLAEAGEDTTEYAALITRLGLPSEIETAGEAARSTVIDLLHQLSEQDLAKGRDEGLLHPDDYTQALKVKRTLSLARGRGAIRERDLTPER
ncbi:hypothetical protein [Endothiovibrio diazotrophicus]